ncbi:MAG: site-specific integrase [Coriobacteriia bacterium]|nr:site-specific integrase [Coriobacteriia bacterium]
MTSTNQAATALKQLIADEQHNRSFVVHANRIIDELIVLLDEFDDDTETIIKTFYSMETGMEPFFRPKPGLRASSARVILMFRDVLQGSKPKKKYLFGKEAKRSAAYVDDARDYEEWMRSNELSEATVRTRLQRADVLFTYLESIGTIRLETLSTSDIVAFITTLENRYTGMGKSNILYTLRNLFSCPVIKSKLTFDPTGLLGNIHTPKHNSIPSVYTKEEVATLLSSIDKRTDSGRMLYLIIMLAAVYGFRSGDIRRLLLSDLDWQRRTISIVQHKTGFPLCLPLTEEVGLALLDYIKNTRRKCNHSQVLIKHRGCPEPYGRNSHLSDYVRQAMIACGIEIGNRRAGLHSLRHSLATNMMSEGVPINEIASILGHVSVQSTTTYVWLDTNHLRIAALEVD